MEGMRSGFSGVVIQHRQGSVGSVFLLGLAFGSVERNGLLLRFCTERRLFGNQDLSVVSFQGVWVYQFC